MNYVDALGRLIGVALLSVSATSSNPVKEKSAAFLHVEAFQTQTLANVAVFHPLKSFQRILSAAWLHRLEEAWPVMEGRNVYSPIEHVTWKEEERPLENIQRSEPINDLAGAESEALQNEPIRIEIARLEHVAAIHKLYYDVYLPALPDLPPPSIFAVHLLVAKDMSWVSTIIDGVGPRGDIETFVALAGTRVVGFAVVDYFPLDQLGTFLASAVAKEVPAIRRLGQRLMDVRIRWIARHPGAKEIYLSNEGEGTTGRMSLLRGFEHDPKVGPTAFLLDLLTPGYELPPDPNDLKTWLPWAKALHRKKRAQRLPADHQTPEILQPLQILTEEGRNALEKGAEEVTRRLQGLVQNNWDLDATVRLAPTIEFLTQRPLSQLPLTQWIPVVLAQMGTIETELMTASLTAALHNIGTAEVHGRAKKIQQSLLSLLQSCSDLPSLVPVEEALATTLDLVFLKSISNFLIELEPVNPDLFLLTENAAEQILSKLAGLKPEDVLVQLANVTHSFWAMTAAGVPDPPRPAADGEHVSFKLYSQLTLEERNDSRLQRLVESFHHVEWWDAKSLGRRGPGASWKAVYDALITYTGPMKEPVGVYSFRVLENDTVVTGNRIFVSESFRRAKVATRLRDELMRILKERGYKTFIVVPPDETEEAKGFNETLFGREGVSIQDYDEILFFKRGIASRNKGKMAVISLQEYYSSQTLSNQPHQTHPSHEDPTARYTRIAA